MTKTNDGASQASLAHQTLAEFTRRGEALTDARHIIHYFYGEPARLPALQAELEKGGYQVRPTATAPGLIAEINGITDQAWAEVTMRAMCDMANRHGAEYDGWEAAMVRQSVRTSRAGSWFDRLFGRS